MVQFRTQDKDERDPQPYPDYDIPEDSGSDVKKGEEKKPEPPPEPDIEIQ